MTYETQEPKQLTKAQPWYASQPGRPSATRARSSYVAFAGSARLAARSSSTQPCHDMPPKTSWERTPATSPDERKANGSARMPPPTIVLSRFRLPERSEACRGGAEEAPPRSVEAPPGAASSSAADSRVMTPSSTRDMYGLSAAALPT